MCLKGSQVLSNSLLSLLYRYDQNAVGAEATVTWGGDNDLKSEYLVVAGAWRTRYSM